MTGCNKTKPAVNQTETNTASSSPNTMIQPSEGQNIAPLATEEDIIRLFFTLINEQRIPEAVAMMSENMAPDDSTKQAWGVNFNTLESISLATVEPFSQADWTESKHLYKVTFTAKVKPGAPNYNWSESLDTRWIEITKMGDKWQINSLATGP